MGHHSGYDYLALAGKRGTLTYSAYTSVSAIALRFIGYEAFSTLPVIVKWQRQITNGGFGSPSQTKGISRRSNVGKDIDSKWLAQILSAMLR